MAWSTARSRTLIDFGDEEGSDGMTVDVDGNIYLAARPRAVRAS